MQETKTKKIVFIASYMKSGNTWMRSIICSLLNNGNFVLDDLKKIKLFSQEIFFSKISNPVFQDNGNYDFNFISKNWIEAQKRINHSLSKEIKIFKTHNVRGIINNNFFTDEHVCKGFIYLIRDPRDIVISLSKHMGISIDESINILLYKKNFVTNVFKVNEAVCTWAQHVKSWINFNKVPRLILKYEDMIKNNHKIILYTKEFLEIVHNNSLRINSEVINKTGINTSFNKLKKLEKKNGFVEAALNNNFFRKGISGQWKNILNNTQTKLIEKELSQLMQDLGYI